MGIITERPPRVIKDRVGRTTGARIGKKLRRRVLISEFGGERDTPTMVLGLALTPKSSYKCFPEDKAADNQGIMVNPRKKVLRASAVIFDASHPDSEEGLFSIDFGTHVEDWETCSMVIAEILNAATDLGITAVRAEFVRPPITLDLIDEQDRQIGEMLTRWHDNYGFLSQRIDQARWVYWMGADEFALRKWDRYLLRVD